MAYITADKVWWGWIGVLIHGAYTMVLWWFAFLSAVQQSGNTTYADPTVLQWLLIAGAIASVVLLTVIAFAGIIFVSNKTRQSQLVWHFLHATFLYVILSVWAALWENRHSDKFPGGSPVIPDSGDPAFVANSKAFIEWKVLLIFMVGFLLFILYSIVEGYRMIIVARTHSGEIGSQTKEVSRRKIKGRGGGEEEMKSLTLDM